MPDLYEPRISVRLAPRSGFAVHTLDERRVLSYSIDSSYMTPTDAVKLVVFDQDVEKLRGLLRQPIEVVLDGNQQMVGQIDVVREGHEGTAVEITARDYLADIIEDHVNPALKVTKDMSVSDALLAAFAPQGITEIEGPIAKRNVLTGVSVGTTAVPLDLKTKKLDDYKANPGENLWSYGDRIAARHGGTMQPSTRRDRIVIGAPDFEQDSSGKIIRRLGQEEALSNNVVGKPTCIRDWSKVPTVCTVVGKQGKAGKSKSTLSFTITLEEYAPHILNDLADEVRESMLFERPAVGTPGSAFAVDIVPHFYRLLMHKDEQATNQAQLERTARRLMAERVRETLKYTCTVRGHHDTTSDRQAMYAVDTVLDVEDEACGIREPMWVAQRTFDYVRGSGAKTKLELWRLNTFSL